MKALKKMIAIVTVVLFTANLFAFDYDDVPSVRFGQEGKRFTLFLGKLSTTTTVRILDAADFVLLEETVEGTRTYGKLFNMETLPAGEYKLVIETPLTETIQPIIVTDKTAILDETKQELIFAPYIKINDNSFDVNKLNLDREDVTVSVINAIGEPIFTEVHKDEVSIVNRYSTSGLSNGFYIIKVETPSRTYFEDLKIK